MPCPAKITSAIKFLLKGQLKFAFRELRLLRQKFFRGWDDSDTWALDSTIIKFTLPRLKRFKEITIGYPPDLTEEGWDSILDHIIWSFEKHLESDLSDSLTTEDFIKIDEGFKLFGKYFKNLWW